MKFKRAAKTKKDLQHDIIPLRMYLDAREFAKNKEIRWILPWDKWMKGHTDVEYYAEFKR